MLTAVEKLTRDGREATISTKDRREPTGDDQTESPPPKRAAKPEVHLTVLPDEDLKCNGTNKVLLPMKKVRILRRATPRAMVNALMDKIFSIDVQTSHSLIGGGGEVPCTEGVFQAITTCRRSCNN